MEDWHDTFDKTVQNYRPPYERWKLYSTLFAIWWALYIIWSTVLVILSIITSSLWVILAIGCVVFGFWNRNRSLKQRAKWQSRIDAGEDWWKNVDN